MRFFVSGAVQGVGFRYFALHAAQKLALAGYTRNLSDGRVEVYALGTTEQLVELRRVLECGPLAATVTSVTAEEAAVVPRYAEGFVVEYDA
jgi:acylphosphatase